MAYADIHVHSSILQTIAAPFAFVGNLLIKIGEASSVGQKVEALNAMSDADLAAAGTTRHQEVQKIFRGYTIM